MRPPLRCGARPGCRCQQCPLMGTHVASRVLLLQVILQGPVPCAHTWRNLTFPCLRLSRRRRRWVKRAAAFGFVVTPRPSNECWDEVAAVSGRGDPEAEGGRPGRGGPRLLPQHKPPHGRRRGPSRSSRSRRASSGARGVLGEAARRKGRFRQAAGGARKAGRAADPERGPGAPPPPGLRAPERSLRGVATAGSEPRPHPRGSASRDGLGGFPRLVWRAEGPTLCGRPPNTWPRGSAPGGRRDRDREDQPAGVSRATCSRVSASDPLAPAPALSRTGHHACAGCRPNACARSRWME